MKGPPLTPPEPTHMGINSKIRLYLEFRHDASAHGYRGEAAEWIQGVIDSMGLEGKFFLEYDHHNKEYTFRAIMDGWYDMDKAFRKAYYDEYNPFEPEDEIKTAIGDQLEKHDIYGGDWKVDILDFEVVDCE